MCSCVSRVHVCNAKFFGQPIIQHSTYNSFKKTIQIKNRINLKCTVTTTRGSDNKKGISFSQWQHLMIFVWTLTKVERKMVRSVITNNIDFFLSVFFWSFFRFTLNFCIIIPLLRFIMVVRCIQNHQTTACFYA